MTIKTKSKEITKFVKVYLIMIFAKNIVHANGAGNNKNVFLMKLMGKI